MFSRISYLCVLYTLQNIFIYLFIYFISLLYADKNRLVRLISSRTCHNADYVRHDYYYGYESAIVRVSFNRTRGNSAIMMYRTISGMYEFLHWNFRKRVPEYDKTPD